jgi:hypothetical protein
LAVFLRGRHEKYFPNAMKNQFSSSEYNTAHGMGVSCTRNMHAWFGWSVRIMHKRMVPTSIDLGTARNIPIASVFLETPTQ